MNQRVLKNGKREHFKTNFRGREITFKSKSSKIFDWDDEEARAEYEHWINIYPFLYDITGLFPKKEE